MNEQVISWRTDFNTAQNLMIHTFTDRVKVVSDIKTGTVKVLKDGGVINTIENFKLIKYESLLVEIAKDAIQLESFKTE